MPSTTTPDDAESSGSTDEDADLPECGICHDARATCRIHFSRGPYADFATICLDCRNRLAVPSCDFCGGPADSRPAVAYMETTLFGDRDFSATLCDDCHDRVSGIDLTGEHR